MDQLKSNIDQLAYSINKDSGNVNHETFKRIEQLIDDHKLATEKKMSEL